jgi:hypothetical protein
VNHRSWALDLGTTSSGVSFWDEGEDRTAAVVRHGPGARTGPGGDGA